MRNHFIKCTLALVFVGQASAQILYQKDFSDSKKPGLFRSTSGPSSSDFSDTWSIQYQIKSSGEDQYAEIQLTTSEATPDGISLSGGAFFYGQSVPHLPDSWSLTFDFFADVVEPIRIEVYTPLATRPHGLIIPIKFTNQTTPTQVGWNTISLTNLDFTASQANNRNYNIEGFELRVLKTSEDQIGNMLSLSNAGIHTLGIDNVLISSIPEPRTLSLLFLSLIGLAAIYRRSDRQFRSARQFKVNVTLKE